MALFSDYHANPPNHYVNPLQTHTNWSKDRDRSGKHASRSSVGRLTPISREMKIV